MNRRGTPLCACPGCDVKVWAETHAPKIRRENASGRARRNPYLAAWRQRIAGRGASGMIRSVNSVLVKLTTWSDEQANRSHHVLTDSLEADDTINPPLLSYRWRFLWERR